MAQNSQKEHFFSALNILRPHNQCNQLGKNNGLLAFTES